MGMLLLLLGIDYLFHNNVTKTRDMVYYNEQQILVKTEIEQRKEIKDIEAEYDCHILFLNDANYEIEIQSWLQKEALILDYRNKDKLIGKIIWNVKEEGYQKIENKLKTQVIIIWLIFFISGYLLFAFFYIQLIRPFQDLRIFSNQVAKET